MKINAAVAVMVVVGQPVFKQARAHTYKSAAVFVSLEEDLIFSVCPQHGGVSAHAGEFVS